MIMIKNNKDMIKRKSWNMFIFDNYAVSIAHLTMTLA